MDPAVVETERQRLALAMIREIQELLRYKPRPPFWTKIAALWRGTTDNHGD
jgi:hypothetical protein